MEKFENYIISGIGYETGKYRISTTDIENAVNAGFLTGFDNNRIEESESYRNALHENPGLSAFAYMTEMVMGFKTRYYVVPFPPVSSRYKYADNSLDLCVRAVEKALSDAGVHPENIDAWMVSTATPHEQAPGLAETLKGYFTGYNNHTQTMTITSACVGFNYNLERAVIFFKNNPAAQHVLIAHTEVMSQLLVNETYFVPFTTFGDSAAAVVLSRVTGRQKEGLIGVVNYEDLRMIDFLGANRKGDLYMNARMVKKRAVPNIAGVFSELCKKSEWATDDVDVFVPHQTGNAIVHDATEIAGISKDKVFQEVQLNMGNLSGASVPASLSVLKSTDRLKPGLKIITSVAGLGGEYGGFSYIVPHFNGFKSEIHDLTGKTALLTGSTGGLGAAIASQLAIRGANIILQYNTNSKKANLLKQVLSNYKIKTDFIKADFNNLGEVEKLAEEVLSKYPQIDYLIHTVAVSGQVDRALNISDDEMKRVFRINKEATELLTEKLFPIVKETVLFTGSVAEDAQFSGSSPYIASKKALHSYAFEFASKAYNKGIRCIYYMPGIIDGGMGDLLNMAQKTSAKMQIEQSGEISPKDIADRMVRSLYLPKVINTRNLFENKLNVRKDGYFKF